MEDLAWEGFESFLRYWFALVVVSGPFGWNKGGEDVREVWVVDLDYLDWIYGG